MGLVYLMFCGECLLLNRQEQTVWLFSYQSSDYGS